MGKKTTNTKPAAPAKRAVKTKPAAEKTAVPEPPAVKPKATVPEAPAAKPKAVVRPTKPKVSKAPKKPSYSQDDVALRAYFIAERRQTAGLPGDAHQDWIEAERQLASEARAAAQPKAKKG